MVIVLVIVVIVALFLVSSLGIPEPNITENTNIVDKTTGFIVDVFSPLANLF